MTGSVLRHRWFVMAIIFLARTTMAMQFQSVAPVAPLVVADLGITYAQLGLLIGLYLLPGTVLALPGGLLGQRFGNRRVALWGLALMVIGGLVTASSHSLWPASAGRILSGAGGVLLNLILAKMTAEWFAGKEISTAMGVMLTSWPFGIGLGAALFGAVGAASSWRLVQHLAAALAAGAFVLVALFGRDAPGVGDTRAALRFVPNLTPRGWALALTAGAAWMLVGGQAHARRLPNRFAARDVYWNEWTGLTEPRVVQGALACLESDVLGRLGHDHGQPRIDVEPHAGPLAVVSPDRFRPQPPEILGTWAGNRRNSQGGFVGFVGWSPASLLLLLRSAIEVEDAGGYALR